MFFLISDDIKNNFENKENVSFAYEEAKYVLIFRAEFSGIFLYSSLFNDMYPGYAVYQNGELQIFTLD